MEGKSQNNSNLASAVKRNMARMAYLFAKSEVVTISIFGMKTVGEIDI